jgi:hypothetical protein
VSSLDLHGRVVVELQSDWTYRSSDATRELADTYFTVEPSFSLALSEEISLEGGLVLEPVTPPVGGENRWVDDEGLWIEELFLRYETESWELHIGKFNPAFGVAWDQAPGIYAAEFAEDYELSERLGLGGSLQFGNARSGTQQLSAEVFFVDKSPLSRSVLQSRGHTRERDGGLGNSGDLRSFSVTLRSERLLAISGLSYQLGLSHQDGGSTLSDETAWALAVAYGFPIGNELEVQLLSEYVYQHDADGDAQQRHYLTGSAAASWRAVNLALSYAQRNLLRDVASDVNDDLFQVSVGYELGFGLGSGLASLSDGASGERTGSGTAGWAHGSATRSSSSGPGQLVIAWSRGGQLGVASNKVGEDLGGR